MTAPTPDTLPALVLVVDDNPTNRYVLNTTLRRAGHTVLEAADGTQALALLASADPVPEAAIVDVRLPDMTGFDVCERIKTQPSTASLPVIHVSATAITATDRTHGLNRGADAYLTEPIAPDELLATITATLRYTRARHRAEELARRLQELNRTTLALYSAATTADVAQAAAAGAASILGAPAVALLTSPQGVLVSSQHPPVPTAEDSAPALPHGHAGDQVGVRLHTVLPRDWPSLPSALAGHPEITVLLARTKPSRPTICLALPRTALAAPDDEKLLTQLGHACALALEALRSYSEEHDLALTLQRSFLPESLPHSDLADLAVRYQPASDRAEIGGDFYEALPLPGGLLMAVGDVAGHSLDAAMLMGQIRHALRAYAIEGHPPHQILEQLDRLLTATEARLTVTLCIVLAERETGILHIANAGHLPPLIRRPDGSTLWAAEHGPLLGLGLPQPPAVTLHSEPGAVMLLITDGLIERPGTDLDRSLDQLASTVRDCPQSLEDLCDTILNRFPPNGRDDIALMAIRFTGGAAARA
ncbi:SpoIIE family protein phosphatase [Streptomyces vinaceus]|uniref:SpoIIE family protein phosphatase n=1 Tax=Streptomyces vinaceus TaxID=1960 RepID=UPI00380CB231